MLRAPSPAEAIAQAIAAAKATDIAVDRVSILRSVIAALDNPRTGCPRPGHGRRASGRSTRSPKKRAIEKTYAGLTASTLKRATAAAGRADVRAVRACAGRGRSPRSRSWDASGRTKSTR